MSAPILFNAKRTIAAVRAFANARKGSEFIDDEIAEFIVHEMNKYFAFVRRPGCATDNILMRTARSSVEDKGFDRMLRSDFIDRFAHANFRCLVLNRDTEEHDYHTFYFAEVWLRSHAKLTAPTVDGPLTWPSL